MTFNIGALYLHFLWQLLNQSFRCQALTWCAACMQIDYINLTYTCSGMDVYEMREFLDEHSGENIKIIAKVGPWHI